MSADAFGIGEKFAKQLYREEKAEIERRKVPDLP
jgi:hypothetical protein